MEYQIRFRIKEKTFKEDKKMFERRKHGKANFDKDGMQELAMAVILGAYKDFKSMPLPAEERIVKWNRFVDTEIWFNFFPEIDNKAIKEKFANDVKGEFKWN